jgi:hypothetical protein
MASAKKKSSSTGLPTSDKRATATKPRRPASSAPVLRSTADTHHYAVCVRNDGYPASLELRKLYVVLEDAFADKHEMIRVIDESGGDYLYHRSYFVRVE